MIFGLKLAQFLIFLTGKDEPAWKNAVDRFVMDKSSESFDPLKFFDNKSILKDLERSLKKSLISSFQEIKTVIEIKKLQIEFQLKQAETNLKHGFQNISKQTLSSIGTFFKQLKEVCTENSKVTLKKVHDLLYKELDLITQKVIESRYEDLRKFEQHNVTLKRISDLINSQTLSLVTNEMKTLDINLNTLRDALLEKFKAIGFDKKLTVEFLILNFQIAKLNSKTLKDLREIFSKRKSMSEEQLYQVLNKIFVQHSQISDYIVQRCKSFDFLSRNCLQWAHINPGSKIVPVFVQKQTEPDFTFSVLTSTEATVSTSTILDQLLTSTQLDENGIQNADYNKETNSPEILSTTTLNTHKNSIKSTILATQTPLTTKKKSLDLQFDEQKIEDEIRKNESGEELLNKLGFKSPKKFDNNLKSDEEMDESDNSIKNTKFNLIKPNDHDFEKSMKRLKLTVDNSLNDLKPNFFLNEGYICIKLSQSALREIQGS